MTSQIIDIVRLIFAELTRAAFDSPFTDSAFNNDYYEFLVSIENGHDLVAFNHNWPSPQQIVPYTQVFNDWMRAETAVGNFNYHDADVCLVFPTFPAGAYPDWRPTVVEYASNDDLFIANFANALMKMSTLGVLPVSSIDGQPVTLSPPGDDCCNQAATRKLSNLRARALGNGSPTCYLEPYEMMVLSRKVGYASACASTKNTQIQYERRDEIAALTTPLATYSESRASP